MMARAPYRPLRIPQGDKNTVPDLPSGAFGHFECNNRLFVKNKDGSIDEYPEAKELDEQQNAFNAAIAAHNTSEISHSDMRIGISGFDSRIANLESIVSGGIATNPFSVSFDTLTGLTVTGVWNQDLERIEF